MNEAAAPLDPHDDTPDGPLDARRRRLLFRATHRGTQEADLLIGGFVRARIGGLADHDLDALEAVMNLVDADLVDWLLGRTAIPPDSDSPMLRRMLDHAHRKEPRP